ncbi:MAG: hypothetical protein L0027_00490, partial [Candidatus Rokubacteria bacterium]|nr:hypothetical protein [Candidatus Rokubacteria bacterium]
MRRALAGLSPLAATFLVVGVALARPGTPPRSAVHDLLDAADIDHRGLAALDVLALLEEDASPREKPAPFRVALARPLRLGPDDSGTWETLPAGGRVWRLRVSSPGAVFLSFKLSELDLPEGAELHFVSVPRAYYDGPYTWRHNRPFGRFGSPMIPGDSAVIELLLPPGAGRVRLRLESVSHGYRNVMGMGAIPAREGAPAAPTTPPAPLALAGPIDCQRDVNCPEGAPYQDVKRAVAEGYDGQFICSGQLLNNVRQDNRYLYLTAAHCEWWIDPPSMVYYWNYENSGCGTNDAPLTFSTGSTDLYHSAATDLDLLELDGTDLEGDFDIYFVGWNRSPAAPTAGATISFPSDKPKQIAIENDPVSDCAPGGCAGGFGAEFWRVEGWDVGVTEGGSSGAALLDPDQLLVGVLTGGVGANCNNFVWDEFAKLYPAWANLQPFLDPDASGVVSLPGKDHAGAVSAPAASAWARALLAGLLLLVAGGKLRGRGAGRSLGRASRPSSRSS